MENMFRPTPSGFRRGSEDKPVFAAGVEAPAWKRHLSNSTLVKTYKDQIGDENRRAAQDARSEERRKAPRAPSWKSGIGTVKRKLDDGTEEEYDANDLLNDPEAAPFAEESLFKRDVFDTKGEIERRSLLLQDPSRPKSLTDRQREDMNLEMMLLDDKDARKQELSKRIADDDAVKAERSDHEQKIYENKMRLLEMSQGGIAGWRERQKVAPTLAGAVENHQAVNSRAAEFEQRAADLAAEEAELMKPVRGADLAATAPRRAELALKREQLEADMAAFGQEREQSAATVAEQARRDADAMDAAKQPEKDFFRLGDTISGIWDAVKGLGVTAPAAFYQLVEGMERPDQYSESAKKAFAEADAFNQAMQAKTEANQAAGVSSSVGESFREAGGSLGFSLGSMAAAIPASIAGTKVGAATGGAIGAGVGAVGAGVVAVPGAGVGATIGGAIGGVSAGMAASGTAAYRMAGAQFLNETFNAGLQEYEAVNGAPMPEAERKKLYDALMPIAKNTALWEAGPEAVGNAFMLGAGKIILGSTAKKIAAEAAKDIPGLTAKRMAAIQAGKVAGSTAEREAIEAATKKVGSRFLNTKLGKLTAGLADVPVEITTEALTHIEQTADQQKGHMIARGEDPSGIEADWSVGGMAHALKEVTPQTLALMGLMLGGSGAVKGTYVAGEKLIEKLNPEVEKSPVTPERVNAEILANDPDAAPITSEEFADARDVFGDDPADAAEGVIINREIAAVEAEAAQGLADAEAQLLEAQASGDKGAVTAAETILKQARGAAAVGDRLRGALKIARPGETPLTDKEASALGLNKKGEEYTPMTAKELEAVGLTKPLIAFGADGSPVILDEVIAEIRSISPAAADRIKLSETKALEAAQERFEESKLPDQTFTVTGRAGTTLTVKAKTAEEAQSKAVADPAWPMGEQVSTTTANEPNTKGKAATPPVQVPPVSTGAPRTANASANGGGVAGAGSAQAQGEGAVATLTVTPSEDTPIGANAAGEALFERKDGSRYRMRNDRGDRPNGYPDFGGDLVNVSPPPTPKPATDTAKAVLRRVTRLKKNPKLAAAIVVSTDPSVRVKATDDGRIFINLQSLAKSAEKAGLKGKKAETWIASVIDEEIRHLAGYEAARAQWEAEGSPGTFESWRDAHYGAIWEQEFVAKGMAEEVRALYSPKAFDALEPWEKAFEGMRMVSQKLATGNPTEASLLLTNRSAAFLAHIRAALKALKDFVAGIDASPALLAEIAAMEAALATFQTNEQSTANPRNRPKKQPAVPPTDGDVRGTEKSGNSQAPVDGAAQPPRRDPAVSTPEGTFIGKRVSWVRRGESLSGVVDLELLDDGMVRVVLSQNDSKGMGTAIARVADLDIQSDTKPAETPANPASAETIPQFGNNSIVPAATNTNEDRMTIHELRRDGDKFIVTTSRRATGEVVRTEEFATLDEARGNLDYFKMLNGIVIDTVETEASPAVKAPAAKPALTPDEQALKDAFSGMVDGLEAADLNDANFYGSKGIPRDKRAVFMDVADQLFDAGVRTPNDLAAKLEKVGGGKLRAYSDAVWSIMRANYPELPQASDWAGVYGAMDKPVTPKPTPRKYSINPAIDFIKEERDQRTNDQRREEWIDSQDDKISSRDIAFSDWEKLMLDVDRGRRGMTVEKATAMVKSAVENEIITSEVGDRIVAKIQPPVAPAKQSSEVESDEEATPRALRLHRAMSPGFKWQGETGFSWAKQLDEMLSLKDSGERFPTMRFLSSWNNGMNLPLVKAFFKEVGIPPVKGWSQSGIKAALEQWAPATDSKVETVTAPAAETKAAKKTARKSNTDPKKLKAQKEYLLAALDKAIEEAPDTGETAAERIIEIEVPGDGTFRIVNDKSTLKDFRKRAGTRFPTTAAKASIPTSTTPRETAITKIGSPQTNKDFIEIASMFASDDPQREVLHNVQSDGENVVATNGHQIFVVEKNAGGTAEKPVHFNGKTLKPVKPEAVFPPWKQVIPKDFTFETEIDTATVQKIVIQAKSIAGKEPSERRLIIWRDEAGKLGYTLDNTGDGTVENQGEGMFSGGEANPETSKPVTVMNVFMLLDGLKALRAMGHERVKLSVSDVSSMLSAEGVRYVQASMGLGEVYSHPLSEAEAQRLAEIEVNAPAEEAAPVEAEAPTDDQVYDDSLKAFRAASKKFKEAQEKYRAKQITDSEFIEAKNEFKVAEDAADSAERAFIDAKNKPKTPEKPAPVAGKPAEKQESATDVSERKYREQLAAFKETSNLSSGLVIDAARQAEYLGIEPAQAYRDLMEAGASSSSAAYAVETINSGWSRDSIKSENFQSDFAVGDRVTFTPKEKGWSVVTGTIQDKVKNTSGGVGYQIFNPTESDSYRVTRVWLEDGEITKEESGGKDSGGKAEANDPNIGREWDSRFGRQRIRGRVADGGTNDITYPSYEVETIGSGAIRRYRADRIEETIKSNEYELTPAFKKEQDERKKADLLEAEGIALRAEKKQKELDAIAEFTKGMPGLYAGKVREALMKVFSFDGKAMTRKEKVEELVASGEKPEIRQEDVVKEWTRQQMNRADNFEQQEYEKKRKAGGKKSVYYVGGYEMGKIGHDYALFLNSIEITKDDSGGKDSGGKDEAETPADPEESPAEAKEREQEQAAKVRSRQLEKMFGPNFETQLQGARNLWKTEKEWRYNPLLRLRETIATLLMNVVGTKQADQVATAMIEGKPTIIDKILAYQSIKESELKAAGIFPSSITSLGYERGDRAVYSHPQGPQKMTQAKPGVIDYRGLKIQKASDGKAYEIMEDGKAFKTTPTLKEAKAYIDRYVGDVAPVTPRESIPALTDAQQSLIDRAEKAAANKRASQGDFTIGFSIHRLPGDQTAYLVESPKNGSQNQVVAKISSDGEYTMTTREDGAELLRQIAEFEQKSRAENDAKLAAMADKAKREEYKKLYQVMRGIYTRNEKGEWIEHGTGRVLGRRKFDASILSDLDGPNLANLEVVAQNSDGGALGPVVSFVKKSDVGRFDAEAPITSKPTPTLPESVSQEVIDRMDREIERVESRRDKLQAINDKMNEESRGIPGSFATGRSNQHQGLVKRRGAMNDRLTKSFNLLQEAEEKLKSLKEIREGYASGERHENGQPRANSPSRKAGESAVDEYGDYLRATVKKGDRITFASNPAPGGSIVKSVNKKTITLEGGTSWSFDYFMPWKDGKEMTRGELSADLKAWRSRDEAAAESPSIETLESMELVRQWGDKWQYKMRVGGTWYYANSKEGAIESAVKAYNATPEAERKTRKQLDAEADVTYDAKSDELFKGKSREELEKMLADIERDIAKLQAAGKNEFTGQGTRRTGAATSNEAARGLGETKMRLERYLREKFATTPDTAVESTADIETFSPEQAASELSKRGITLQKDTTKNGKTVWRITGKTFDVKDQLKALGAKWYAPSKAWSIFSDEDPTTKIANVLAGKPVEGEVSPRPQENSGTGGNADEDLRLRELRERLDSNPDERGARGDAISSVDADTAALIRRGLKFGMPPSVVEDQIEDVAMITSAFTGGKPMFLLGNGAGTGKTFVLGGAIREMRSKGATSFVYVTMNTDLIDQIKKDLEAFGIQDVQFHTYNELSNKGVNLPTGSVLIFDEAHSVKNEDSSRGGVGQDMMGRAKFTIFASATPFENPVEAGYFAGTGIFNQMGGHTEFAKAYGANVRKVKGYDKNGNEIVKEYVYWTAGKLEDGMAARQWFTRQGIMITRPMQLPMEMVESQFSKHNVDQKWVDMHNKVEQAYDSAMAEFRDDDGKILDARNNAMVAMHMVNTVKRILEASKVDQAVKRAQAILSEGGNVVLFVETKADRWIGRYRASAIYDKKSPLYSYPEMRDMMREWEQEAAMARRMKERPGPRPFAEAIMSIARAMHSAGIEYELPSVEQELVERLGGKSKVGIYTGSVTGAAATKDKAAFLAGEKKVIVATMAKGGTGLSLHDRVGDRPTSQININLPWKASGVDQVSARVARYGLQSKAYIEWLFAENIPFERSLAYRVGRRMRDMGAIVKGVDMKAANVLADGFDFEGSVDVKQVTGEVDVAEADIFEAAERLEKSRRQRGDQSNGFFETPFTLSALMTVVSGVRGRLLEPSGGRGNLVRFAKDSKAVTSITIVEQRADNVDYMKGSLQAGTGKIQEIIQGDFMEEADGLPHKFDTIHMNPPFERKAGIGAQDVAHVMAAYDLLASDGRLVAIMGEGAFFRSTNQERTFRQWLDDNGAIVVRLPENAFKNSNTGVRARMVILDRNSEDGRTDINLGDMDADSLRSVAEAIPARKTGTSLQAAPLDRDGQERSLRADSPEWKAMSKEERVEYLRGKSGGRDSADADYLAAVERGDMATAQRMVDEAFGGVGFESGPIQKRIDEINELQRKGLYTEDLGSERYALNEKTKFQFLYKNSAYILAKAVAALKNGFTPDFATVPSTVLSMVIDRKELLDATPETTHIVAPGSTVVGFSVWLDGQGGLSGVVDATEGIKQKGKLIRLGNKSILVVSGENMTVDALQIGGNYSASGKTGSEEWNSSFDNEISRKTSGGKRSYLNYVPTMQYVIEIKSAPADDSVVPIVPLKLSLDPVIYKDGKPVPLSERFNLKSPSILEAAPLDQQSRIDRLMDTVGTPNPEIMEEVAEQQRVFKSLGKKVVGRPDLANPGRTEEERALFDQVDEARKWHATRETFGQWIEAANKRNTPENDADLIEKLLSNAAMADKAAETQGVDAAPSMTPEDTIHFRMMMERRFREAKGDKKKLAENAVLRNAYRSARAAIARSLASGRDIFKTPEERNREVLVNLITELPIKAMRQIDARKWSSPQARDQAVQEEIEKRLAAFEKQFKKLGITLEELTNKEVFLSLSQNATLKNIVKNLATAEKMAVQMMQKGAGFDAIRRRTGLPEAKIEAIRAKVDQELREKLYAKVKAGMTLEDLRDQLKEGGLNAADLNAAAPLTEAQIQAELDRIIAVGFGIPKEIAKTSGFKPRKVKVPKKPHEVDWNRPEFSDGLKSYVFEDKNRGAIMQKVIALRDIVGAAGRVNALTGEKRAKADVILGQIENLLKQSGTSVQEVLTGGVPDYRFDIGDSNHVAMLARTIQAMNADLIDKAQEYAFASMLSGLQTNEVNLSGGIVNSTWQATVDRAFEATINLFFNDPANATFGEVKYMVRAMGPVLSRAWSNAVATWGSESPMFEEDILNRPPDLEKMREGVTGYRSTSIGGTTGRIIRMPLRGLLAADNYVATARASVEVGAMAYRLARMEGLKPGSPEFEAYVKKEVNIPGSPAWQLAAQKAYEGNFNNALPGQETPILGADNKFKKAETKTVMDGVGAGIRKISEGLTPKESDDIQKKIGKALVKMMFFPFVRVPYNILKQGIDRSVNPISLAEVGTLLAANLRYRDGKWTMNADGQKQRIIESIGKQLQGTMFVMMLLALGEGDDDDLEKKLLITGSRPYKDTKKGERELGYRTGLGPYEISFRGKDGKRYGFSYGRIEPFATIMGGTVDMLKNAKASKKDRITKSEALGNTLNAYVAQTNEKTMLRGAADLMGLINNDKPLDRYTADRISMIMPNLVKQAVRESDGYFRETPTEFQNMVLYGIWPAGMGRPIRTDLYGAPQKKDGSAAQRIVDFTDAGATDAPKDSDRMLYNWIRQNPATEGLRSVPIPQGPSKNWTDPLTNKVQPMTAGQRAKFGEIAGTRLRALTKGMVFNTDTPTEFDMKRFRAAIDRSREDARKILYRNPTWRAMK